MRVLSLLCMQRPQACLAAWAALCVVAVLAVPRIAVEGLPRIEMPVLQVITVYPQTPAEAVEREITVPVENALSAVPGVRRIESVIKLGITRTTLHLEPGSSPAAAAARVREQIDALYPSFPHGAEKPIVLSSELSRTPAAVLALSPRAGAGLTELASPVQYELLPLLNAVPEFATIRLRGLQESELVLELPDRLLSAAEKSPEQIARRVREALRPYAVGSVEDDGIRHMVRIAPEVRSKEDLLVLPVQAALELGQLGSVQQTAPPVEELFLAAGVPAVGLEIFAAPEHGEMRAVAALHSMLPELEQRFAGRMRMKVVDEAGAALGATLISVVFGLVVGVPAAFVVLLPSFRSPTAAIVPAAALPATLVAVLPVLELLGVSINLVTLTGFVVVIGMVFDNAIMVTDRLMSIAEFTVESGADCVGDLAEGLIAATATTMIVLLPVLSLGGTLGLLFAQAAVVMLVLPAASLVAAVTLIPSLFVLLHGRLPERGSSSVSPAWISLPAQLFRRRNGAMVLSLALVLLCVAALRLPREVLPSSGERGYELHLRFPPGLRASTAEQRLGQIYGHLEQIAGTAPRFARAGVDSSNIEAVSGDSEAENTAVFVIESPLDLDQAALDPDLQVELRPRVDPLVAALNAGGEHSVYLRLRDRAQLDSVPVPNSAVREQPGIELVFSAYALQNARSSRAELLESLRYMGSGLQIGELPVAGHKQAVRLQLSAELESLELYLPGGRRSLGLLATHLEREFPTALYRSGRVPALPLGPDQLRQLEETWDLEAAQQLGISIYEPQSEQADQTASELLRAVVASVLLMLLLLTAVFESLRQAALVLVATFPCAATALSAVWLSGGSINLGLGLGMIMLFGNAVNTTILPASLMRRRGVQFSALDAVGELGRGIALSTLSTAAALLPSMVAGARFPGLQSYTAVPLFFGLLIGTPLSLVVFVALSNSARGAEHA